MIKKVETLPNKGKPDKAILIFAALMTFFGIIMIFNSSAYVATEEFGNQFYFLNAQIVWVGLGIITGIVVYFLDYHRIAKIILPLLLINLVLLVLVLMFGDEINGAKRWFEIASMRIQPSEFIKPILIIYLATWLARYKDVKDASREIQKKDAIKKIVSFLVVLAIVAGLIMFQPDMGTTMIICLTALAIFFLTTTNVMQTVGLIGVTIIGFFASIVAIIVEPYRFERIRTYIQLIIQGDVADPRGTGYQLQQILIGVGSSGFWGKGFGQSRQRFGYLVENTAFTDSIFAVVLEELGFLSAIIIIGLWIFFFFKGYQIAKNAPDRQGQIIAMGITIWLTLQTLLNIAANIGIIPITGLPLPFLTYGGSSTIVTFVGIAMLLNISRYGNTVKSTKPFYGKIR